MLNVMMSPFRYGPGVTKVLTTARSAESTALPPLPVLSVLFAVFGSGCAAVAVALLSKAPAALIVAVTKICVLPPEPSEAIVHGNDEQPLPLTFVMVRLLGVSVTWMLVAVWGPALETVRV